MSNTRFITKNHDTTAIYSDTTISWKAKGMLLSLLNSTVDTKEALIGMASDGAASIRGGLDELRSAGYIQLKKYINPRGQVIRWEYEVFGCPLAVPVASYITVKTEDSGEIINISASPASNRAENALHGDCVARQEIAGNETVQSVQAAEFDFNNDAGASMTVPDAPPEFSLEDIVASESELPLYETIISLINMLWNRTSYKHKGQILCNYAIRMRLSQLTAKHLSFLVSKYYRYATKKTIPNPAGYLSTMILASPDEFQTDSLNASLRTFSGNPAGGGRKPSYDLDEFEQMMQNELMADLATIGDQRENCA